MVITDTCLLLCAKYSLTCKDGFHYNVFLKLNSKHIRFKKYAVYSVNKYLIKYFGITGYLFTEW